jgi:hypothetical protein
VLKNILGASARDAPQAGSEHGQQIATALRASQ